MAKNFKKLAAKRPDINEEAVRNVLGCCPNVGDFEQANNSQEINMPNAILKDDATNDTVSQEIEPDNILETTTDNVDYVSDVIDLNIAEPDNKDSNRTLPIADKTNNTNKAKKPKKAKSTTFAKCIKLEKKYDTALRLLSATNGNLTQSDYVNLAIEEYLDRICSDQSIPEEIRGMIQRTINA